MNKKKELGKGLRALLSNIEKTTNPAEKAEIVKELNSSISLVEVAKIEVNPFQPRVDFNAEELEELSKSIEIHGLIQPITLRSMGGDQYQLISGERRLRAAKMAGHSEVPAYIRVANDQEMLEMSLIENIQRAELNAIEIAISYQRLMDECKLTHELLSERVGKNRSTITNYVRLLKLAPEVQNSIKKGELSMGHARAIVGLQDISTQLMVYRKAIQEHLSVRDLEKLISAISQDKKHAASGSPKGDNVTNAEIEKIVKQLSATFGSKVEIKRSHDGKGQIIIRFKSDKEFNDIYDILKDKE